MWLNWKILSQQQKFENQSILLFNILFSLVAYSCYNEPATFIDLLKNILSYSANQFSVASINSSLQENDSRIESNMVFV